MKTVNVRFVQCGGNAEDIEIADVPVTDGDEVQDVIDRAAAMYIPAETVDHEREDCPNLDEDQECHCADDCFGEGFFFRDNGISTSDTWYGQIFRPVSARQGNGNTSATGRVWVDVSSIRSEMSAGSLLR